MQNSKQFTVALLQVKTTKDKLKNLEITQQMIQEAKEKGAKVVILPQFFNSPYWMESVPEYAQDIVIEEVPTAPFDFKSNIPPNTTTFLSCMAKHFQIYLIGGSIPSRSEGGKFANSCLCFDSEGQLKARFDKMHLCDIAVKNQIAFQQGDTIEPGTSLTVFKTPFATFGIAICYDIRFPELHMLYTLQGGINFMVYPAALNKTFGPMQFDVFASSRAIDTQSYVAICSPAIPPPDEPYPGYGHSQLVDPWGKQIYQAGYQQELILLPVDMAEVEKVRDTFKLKRRNDLYQLEALVQIQKN